MFRELIISLSLAVVLAGGQRQTFLKVVEVGAGVA
jgi:hypothetical protein